MKEISFEQALKRLEKIAEDLENDDIALDASLKHYEEGMKLIHICNRRLDEAKKKVDILTGKAGKKFQLKNFDTETVGE